MRKQAKEFIQSIDRLRNEDIRLFSKMIVRELYNIDRDSKIDYIGQIKNDLQWIMYAVEEAETRMDETLELGHQLELPSHLMVERIENTTQYLLTEKPTIFQTRKNLGVFDNLEEVKEFVNNTCN